VPATEHTRWKWLQEALVRAVDVLEAPIRHPNITWEQRDIVEWLCSLHPADQFEGFFLRHVVQYYDSRWLRGILERLFDMHLQTPSSP
jgi:hypothetical protein